MKRCDDEQSSEHGSEHNVGSSGEHHGEPHGEPLSKPCSERYREDVADRVPRVRPAEIPELEKHPKKIGEALNTNTFPSE